MNDPTISMNCIEARNAGGTGPICDKCNTGLYKECRWRAHPVMHTKENWNFVDKSDIAIAIIAWSMAVYALGWISRDSMPPMFASDRVDVKRVIEAQPPRLEVSQEECKQICRDRVRMGRVKKLKDL